MARGGGDGEQWRYEFEQTNWVKEDHRDVIYCVAFNRVDPSLADLAVSVGGRRATVYRCAPGGAMDPVSAYEEEDVDEQFYACGWAASATHTPLLLLGGARGRLRVVDAAAGRLLWTGAAHGDAVNDVAACPAAPRLAATAGRDNAVVLWDVHARACVAVLRGEGAHRSEVLSLAWHPAAPLLATAAMDSVVSVWDLDCDDVRAAVAAAAAANGAAAPGAGAAGAAAEEEPAVAVAPAIVPVPLFSARTLHAGLFVDCVRWLGPGGALASKATDDRVLVWTTPLLARAGGGGAGGGAGDGGDGPSVDGAGAAAPPPPACPRRVHVGPGAAAAVGAPPVPDCVADLIAARRASRRAAAAAKTGGAAAAAAAPPAAPPAPAVAPVRSPFDEPATGADVGRAGERRAVQGAGPPAGARVLTTLLTPGAGNVWFLRFDVDAAAAVLAVGSVDGRVWLFDPRVGAPARAELWCGGGAVAARKGVKGRIVRQTALSGDGAILLAGCEDGTLWRWDRAAGRRPNKRRK